MRILYICRIFSGFETSLNNNVWKPTGAPTIYRVMEALDQSAHSVDFLMTCRGVGGNYRTDWTETTDQDVQLAGFKSVIHVLAGEHRYKKWLGRVRGLLTQLRHFWHIWKTVRIKQPDLIYIDRSNVFAGALLAHLSSVPIVLRVMGVYPSMWDTLSEQGLQDRITRWAYRAPFSLVLCTQDGSGGEQWLPAALSPKTPFRMLLNGFDQSNCPSKMDPRLQRIPTNCTVILFIGRFEPIKGCEQFVEAILRVQKSGCKGIHAVMVGTGSLYSTVRSRVREAGAEKVFSFIDRLAHDQVPEVLRRSQIYVSLNRLGQLSNANLEAMAMGACMIIPEAQLDRGIDLATESLIDRNAVIRIPWDKQEESLAIAIQSLIENPDRRTALSAHIRYVAERRIQNWDERVKQEFALISEHIGLRV